MSSWLTCGPTHALNELQTMLRHVHKTSAVGVNSWEEGISICRVAQLNSGQYEVHLECKKVAGTDAQAVADALSKSKLITGASDLFISWQPVKPSKLVCWEALVAAIAAACPDAAMNQLPFKRREEAIEHATGRDIREEALQQVAGSSFSARQEAQQFGTAFSRQLFELQRQLMRDVSKDFLRSDACANSKEPAPTAFMQYILCMVKAGGWFCEEALWMAMYGAAFCAEPVVEAVPPAAGDERRQKEQETRQQRRRDKRRRHDEQARQQHRQQRLQQAREAAARLPAELAAAAPDVSSMRLAQLREFLQELGVAAGAAQAAGSSSSSSSSSKKQLLPLAVCCTQLWEAKRLMLCGSHMPVRVHGLMTPAHEAVARMILRLDVSSSSSSSSGNGSRHSSRVAVAEVNKQYKELARAVHPDKIPQVLLGCEGVKEAFTDGFKVLQNARELLLGCSR